MILIKEDKANRATGLSSLYISFDYNPEIVNVIKRCDKYFYDSKTHVWETLISNLAYLLDNLTYIDDITLQLKEETQNINKLSPILKHEYPPFQHQLEMIKYGLSGEHDNFLLLDAPGAGKTNEIIYLAEELHAQANLEHCLIICAINALKTNWQEEIKKFSTLDCRIIGQKITKSGKVTYKSTKERALELLEPIKEFFIIINIESLRDDDVFQALKFTKNNIGMAVIDEVHRMSDPSSQQAKHFLKLNHFPRKIALTGTLITNNPLNAYIPLKWTGQIQSSYTDFKNQHCEYGGFGNHEIIGYKNIDLLKEVLDTCSLRRTIEDYGKDLPPKTVTKKYIELPSTEMQFYEDTIAKIRAESHIRGADGKPVSNLLSLVTRLRQVTACPTVIDP